MQALELGIGHGAVGQVNRRCIAIVNPAGANGKCKHLWAKAAPTIRHELSAGGFSLEECFTVGPGNARQLASRAVTSAADVVLAVGGDGTIHEVVSGLVEAQQMQNETQLPQTALAVLPLGTGSDYARTFGWQLNDARAACQRILSRQLQLADVSRVSKLPPGVSTSIATAAATVAAVAAGTATATAASPSDVSFRGSDLSLGCSYFVNVASCAVGALSAERAGTLKQLGTLCYPLGAALTLLKWRGCQVQVCMNDSSEWQTLDKLTTLVLGHGRFWGGGLQILPEADPCDGLMDVVALQGLGLLDFVVKGHLLRSGKHLGVDGVNVLGKCRRLQVRAAGMEPLAWECDGEPQGHFAAVDICVIPQALKLLSGPPGPVMS